MLLRGPRTAADVIIELPSSRIVLVRRRNPPSGWAIPGGFIEAGETAEEAAIREAMEETGLKVELSELFHVYSDPQRDRRHHTLSVVFLGRAQGDPVAGDDATDAGTFDESDLPVDLAFDHLRILADYFTYRHTGVRPPPRPKGFRKLSEAEQSYLLRLAREEISASVEGRPTRIEEPPAGVLLEPGSAFVSLHRGGQLRGCIGSFASGQPLHEVVRDMACAAAFRDPRFAPLEPSELESLSIEISVLSEPHAAPPDRLIPGLHGVSIALHGRKGVFLPQVARSAGWDRPTLLAEICLKAGLPPDAWRDPAAEITLFTAEVFSAEF